MWRMFQTFMTILVIVEVVRAQAESKVVQLKQGPVLGYKNTQGNFYNFLNIPYATAPTGRDKYKPPLPPPAWTEPYDASNITIACIQLAHPELPVFLPNIVFQEDCLVANIHVPETTATNLSVLVFVHGGAYQNLLGYPFLLNKFVKTGKVIVVTFNYRLGPHGFLCLGTKDIPGNAGMKDMVALLRWIKQNIASFGGNPDDVTINGCSTGGGAVDFLTLSPMAAGLFQKAIPESGVVFGAAGTQVDPLENAKLYAKHLNFTNVNDLNALEEFYKTASNELLVSKLDFVITNTRDSSLSFAPCVEVDTGTGQEMFLDDAPWNYLINGSYNKVPILLGFTSMEGLMQFPDFNKIKNRMNEKFSDFLPRELQFENETQKDEVARRVKEFYFKDRDVSDETVLEYIYYFSDVMFAYVSLRSAKMRILSGDKIYLYEYSFAADNTPINKVRVPHERVNGGDHCDQLIALMDEDSPILHRNGEDSKEYKALKQLMLKYWLNFITTGNPNPEGSDLPPWPAVSGVNSPYMNLNTTPVLEQTSLLRDRARLWDAIYDQHYRLPVPPRTRPATVPN